MTEINNDTINLGQISADEVSINTGQKIIATTEDKLKLALMERQNFLISRDAWIAPFGIFTSVFLTLLTADFRKFYLAAPVWEAIFYIVSVLAFIYLVYALIRRPKKKSIDDFIQQIKKTGQQS